MKDKSVLSTVFAAVAAIALCLPAEIQAWPIGFEGQTTFTGTGHGSAVSASLGGLHAGWAGEIDWRWTGSTGTPEGFAQNFFSYCVDITQYLESPQGVEIISSDDFTEGVAGGASKAAWLFNTYAADIRNNVGGYLNERAAALQLAIWEAMYDGAAPNALASGNFQVTANASIMAYAGGYISAVHGADWASASALVLKTSETEVAGQDQITNITRVPEPATALLLGIGLCVAGFRNRRRPGSVV